MSKRIKIVCYDDNPDYGGHQVMAVLAVEALAKSSSWQPVFFCSPGNPRLYKQLESIAAATGNLDIRSTPFTTRKLQGLRNHFEKTAIRNLHTLIEREHPDIFLCIQGEIEDASLALCAVKPMTIPCISYIPVPHRMTLMGAKFGAVRDALNAYLFKKPDGWITISESMKMRLEERGATAPIEVVHNGININRFVTVNKNSARIALGLPVEKTVIGMIGRIEFNQKQQDFLVNCFSKTWKNREQFHLVITGDGPDRASLEALIGALRLQERVTLLPWQADSTLVYSALDLLVIPSRFEGMPLVMLEALACGIPVIGSARDGMKDLLPAAWTFEAENCAALANVFDFVSEHWKNELPALQAEVRTEYTVEKFQHNFEAALHRFLIINHQCI
ncbi:MAG: hypothetical protein PWQ29_893 [Verrucomicrobiota bacterium]|nr:hypothetical protein [Verrucomicrobiota bacterium]